MEDLRLPNQQNYASYQPGNGYQSSAAPPQAAPSATPLPSYTVASNSFLSTPAYAGGHGVSAGYGQNAQGYNYGAQSQVPRNYVFTETAPTTVYVPVHRTVVRPVEVQTREDPIVVSYDPQSRTFQPPYPSAQQTYGGNNPAWAPGNGNSPGSTYGGQYPSAWSETKQYQPGEIVTAGNGRTYLALRSTTGEGPWSHAARDSPYASGHYGPAWREYDAGHGDPAPPQGPVLVQPLGHPDGGAYPVWNETNAYHPGEIVTAGNGDSYIALRSTTGEGPWSHTAPGSPYPLGPYGPAWAAYDAGHGSPAPPQGPQLQLGPEPPRPFRPGEFQPGTPSAQLQPPDRFVPGEFPAGANRAGAS